MQKVAVIGVGAAGLCALRHLSSRPDEFQGVGFEQNDRVGGTWVYTENTGTDKYGLPVHSSMYKNLRTNLPKEAMAFSDYPFNPDLPSFCRHQDVLEYLESYAQNFSLHQYIKFQTHIKRVHPLDKKNVHGNTIWEVTYSSVSSPDDTTTEEFDAVIVCVGHYSVPLMPDIPGLATFEGSVIHSHNYRVPEEFQGKRVVCLGAAASGQDICLDVAQHAKEVFLSHNKQKLRTPLPANVQQVPGFQHVTPNTVVFNDGQEREIDAIILCTGYRYIYPFMSEESHLKVEEERVTPLYKHLIHTEFPNISFIGVTKNVCPFPQFNNQVQFVLAILDKSMELPSKEEMDMDTEEEYQCRLSEGLPHRHAHLMGIRQWQYNDELAAAANFEPISKAVQNLFNEVHRMRVENLPTYKRFQYQITGPESFVQTAV